MRKRPATDISANAIVNLLSLSPSSDDHASLERIVERPEWTNYSSAYWNLHRCATAQQAMRLLRHGRIPILICERDLPGGSWIEVLEQISTIPDPPFVIVSSRLADHQLWGQALNLGAYDVLAKPFDPQEVIRIVSLAWLHWRERHEPNSRALSFVA